MSWNVFFYPVAHKDLAGNIFASMDKDLSADSDDEDENVRSCEDRQPPELEHDAENSSPAHSDELASNVSENVDETPINEDDIESNVDDENDDSATGSGDGDVESDTEIADDDASDSTGKMSFECYVSMYVSQCSTVVLTLL